MPFLFFVEFFLSQELDIVGFRKGIFADGAAGGFAADLLISSAIFWIYLGVNREPGTWRYMALNLTLGLSGVLPCYLYVKASEQETVSVIT